MSQIPSHSQRAAGRSFRVVGLALVAWIAALGALGLRLEESMGAPGLDFYQFWVAGDMVRAHEHSRGQGVLDLYSPAALHDIGRTYANKAVSPSSRQGRASRDRVLLDNASTPFFYWVFSLITSGHYDRDFVAYVVVSIMCLAGAIVALTCRLGYTPAAIGAAIALAAVSSPVISDSQVVNVNCPQLAIGCIYLLVRDRARSRGCATLAWLFAAGLTMGVFIAFKPNLLLVPVLLGLRAIFTERWRELMAEGIATLMALAAAVAVSSWCFGGASCWLAWIGVMRRLGSDPSMPSEYGNFSLSRAILELSGHNFIGALTAIGLAIALGTIWIGSRRSTPGPSAGDRDIEFRHDVTIFAMAGIVTFLTSGLAWVHYPILIFPIFLVGSAPLPGPQLGRRGQLLRASLLAASIALLLYPPPIELTRFLPIHMPFTSSTWNRCDQTALLLILALAMWMEIAWFPNFNARLWTAVKVRHIVKRQRGSDDCSPE